MTKAVFIPHTITHSVYHTNNHFDSGKTSLLMVLLILLCVVYLVYVFKTLIERDLAYDKGDRLYNRREFIFDLLIPFRGWFIWLISLFKNKQ